VEYLNKLKEYAIDPFLVPVAMADLAVGRLVHYVHTRNVTLIKLHHATGSAKFMDNEVKTLPDRMDLDEATRESTYLISLSSALAACARSHQRMVQFLFKEVGRYRRDMAKYTETKGLINSHIEFRNRLTLVDETLKSVLQQTVWIREASNGQASMV